MRVPVISVGNLTVGGTGKSPLVDYLARHHLKRGRKVGIVSRGYGRRSRGVVVVSDGSSIRAAARDAGDEPMLLVGRNPYACVVVGEDRAAAGRIAIEDLGCEVLLLDDAFQHRRVARDVDIVVVDAANPWGNGRLLPAGPLREPLSSLARADAVVMTRTDESKTPDAVENAIREHTDAPVFRTRHLPSHWINLIDHARLPVDYLKGKKGAAFAGIGNPASFWNTLAAVGVDIVASVTFRDHHWYTSRDLDRVCRAAGGSGAEVVVTTEKDAVRLPGSWNREPPAYALGIDLDFVGGSGAFDTFVESELAKHSEEPHG